MGQCTLGSRLGQSRQGTGNITNGVIRDLKIWKPIAWNFGTSGTSNTYAFNNKNVAVSSTKAFQFNTEGFSAGGSNMIFENNFTRMAMTASLSEMARPIFASGISQPTLPR